MANTTRRRQELKAFFVKNAIPTESNFADLVDAQLNQADDGVFKLAGEPLSVVAATGDQRRTLRLYADYPAANPDWLISLKPAQDPADATTTRAGFGIADGAGNTRLFIDSSTGQLGVGTNNPADKLHVSGGDLRVSGGDDRRLKIVSDGLGAGLSLVARNQGKTGRPHVDFTLGELDSPSYGVRLSAESNTKLNLEALIGDATLAVTGSVAATGLVSAGKVAVGSPTTTYPLDVLVADGSGAWNRLVVSAEAAWGDAGSKHVHIGAGGATGIMFQNPYVSWYAADSRASVRYGRTGGAPGKTYWDVGLRSDGSFTFKSVDDSAGGEQVKIAKSGEVTMSVGMRFNGAAAAHIDVDGALYRTGGNVYLTVDDNFYIRDSTRGVRVQFDTANAMVNVTGGVTTTAGVAATGLVSAGKLAIGQTSATNPLEITLPDGTGTWGKLVVSTEASWGDTGAKHVHIGAGGGAGIMFYNPHVSWHSAESRASIRYGRTGGAAGKTYWDVGVRSDGGFTFKSVDDSAGGEMVKIAKSGEVTMSAGLRVDGNVAAHILADGALYRYGGQVYLTVDDNLYIRDYDTGNTAAAFKTDTGDLTLTGKLTATGFNLRFFTFNVIIQNSSDQPRTVTFKYADNGFTETFVEVYSVIATLSGYSCYGQSNTNFESWGSSKSTDSIPQHTFVRVTKSDKTSVEIKGFCQESAASNSSDNYVLATVVVIGRVA